jgi:hypothetical protein
MQLLTVNAYGAEMTEQQKLYACTQCNKISVEDKFCNCSPLPSQRLEINEKPSIGNEDVFDRIDRELQDIRNYQVKQDKLAFEDQKKINELLLNQHSMTRRIQLLEMHKEQVLALTKDNIMNNDKIKSLEDKVRKHEMTCPHDKVSSLDESCKFFSYETIKSIDRIDKLEDDKVIWKKCIDALENRHSAMQDQIKSLEEKITESHERGDYNRDYGLDLHGTQISILERLDKLEGSLKYCNNMCESNIDRLDKLESKEKAIMIQKNDSSSAIREIQIRLNKLESKEKIQFEHESQEDFTKRTHTDYPELTAEGLYDYARFTRNFGELKEKYDKAIKFIKSRPYSHI